MAETITALTAEQAKELLSRPLTAEQLKNLLTPEQAEELLQSFTIPNITIGTRGNKAFVVMVLANGKIYEFPLAEG